MSDAASALLSIHDVMPETLARVEALLRLIDASRLPPPALLVVPGRPWTDDELRTLARWASAGCELVAHGWLHSTQPRRLWHRFHAAMLSRNVAEHLALDADDIIALMRRAHDWFAAADLPSPTTYIPPAWALGMGPQKLDSLPYGCVETLRGVHLRGAQGHWRFYPLPLVGFEADNRLRATVLRPFNRWSRWRSHRAGRPLRIGIHPQDAELLLREDLLALLNESWHCYRYRDLEQLLPGPHAAVRRG